MTRFTKLLALVSLVASASAAAVVQRNDLVIRGGGGLSGSGNVPVPDKGPDPSTINPTDSNTIAATVQQVDQKTGPTDDAPPSSDIPPTVVTAIDGDVTAAGTSGDALLSVLHDPDSQPDLNTGSTVSKRDFSLKTRDTYEQIFTGTGTGATDRDASIQGTAYLTFTRLDTYDVAACKSFCDGIQACVFVNIFYEYNSDATYNPQIKCAAYGDIHTAAEKTNFGGQQLLPLPTGTSYVQESEGYGADSLAEPTTPDGYELVFGPINGATQASGYMGFALLDKYDVQACANQCNSRGTDPVGGVCQFFNIWRAVVDGSPTTYSCVMYYAPTDQSTATNTGQGSLQVTYSRGYTRINYVIDGGFEDYQPCPGTGYNDGTCDTHATSTWIGDPVYSEIYQDSIYAHTGNTAGILGNDYGSYPNPGSFTPAQPLATVAGKTYVIQLWYLAAYSGPSDEASATLNIQWNGNTVWTHTGYIAQWTYTSVEVTGSGNDVLALTGGGTPDYVFVDDISAFLTY